MKSTSQETEGSYLFNIQINVSAANRGKALEKLLLVLNNAELSYYRIDSAEQQESPQDILVSASVQGQAAPPKSGAAVAKSAIKVKPQPMDLDGRIHDHIKSKRLVRLSINKGLGIKMDIPCRFINFDPDNQLLTVYHVDEKQVYSFKLNEIDDF